MRKYIMINSLSYGGAERVVSRLFDSDIISSSCSLLLLENEISYDISESVDLKVFNGTSLLRLFKVFNFLFSLNESDIVQAHLNKAIMITVLSKLLGSKFKLQVVHCFAYSGYYGRKGFLGKVHKYLFSKLLKRVDFHIFKSNEMVGDFYHVFNFTPKSKIIIYNPYDVENILKKSKEPGIKLSSDTPYNVSVVGRVVISKGMKDIIEIAKKFRSRVTFHVIGDGDYRAQLIEECISENINNVKVYGRQSNPFSYMHQSGIYLSCSNSEGFPNTLVEAMICGAVCVQSDCKTGPKEILGVSISEYKSNEGCFKISPRGLVFPVGDIEAACNAINFVIDNYDTLNNRFSVNSVEFIKSLDANVIISKYISVLEL